MGDTFSKLSGSKFGLVIDVPRHSWPKGIIDSVFVNSTDGLGVEKPKNVQKTNNKY